MTQTSPWRGRRRWISAFVLAAVATAGAVTFFMLPGRWCHARYETLPRFPVRRAEVGSRLRAGGRIESSKQTVITCELENMQFSSSGQSMSAGGRTTILEIVPDGTNVVRDQVLCRLDASEYEELVRQQEIKLQQAKNDHFQAELGVKSAEMALEEYRDGLLPQTLQGLQGQIVTAEADVRRQLDRLSWSEGMLKNGYSSQGQLGTEKDRLLRLEITLQRLQGEQSLLRDFTAPANLRSLEASLASARSILSYQDVRLRKQETSLANFRRQVELCTVRAPHDGFVIYAKRSGREPMVEVGAEVFQKMKLFYLPDLGQMEVQTVLNESMVDRVRENMSARVRAEGLPDYQMEGHVTSVAPLPEIRGDIPAGLSDVKNYIAKIRLHSSPKGLLPGMSADVEIQTGHTESALVIPPEAVVVEDGKDYCFVANEDGLERRQVQRGKSTSGLLEIRSGLEEGEEIIRDPSLLNEAEVELAESHAVESPEPTSQDPVAAASLH